MGIAKDLGKQNVRDFETIEELFVALKGYEIERDREVEDMV